MGELLGIPEWLAVLIWLVFALGAFLIFGLNRLRNARERLAVARPSPTREEFLELLASDMRADTAAFLWDKALFYVRPLLTPHPDDELSNDLRIDDDDWSMDWPRDYAREQGFHESNYPDWPDGWPATLRNFGKWLEMGAVS